MPWLLDGNNLARGGDREAVRRAALALARSQRLRVLLLFDGAPPAGSPAVERLGAVEIRYVPNADLAVLTHLAAGGRGWRLATDDRALAGRARGLGAQVVSSDQFWAVVAASAERLGPAQDKPGDHVATGPLENVERLEPEPGRVRRRPTGRRPRKPVH